MKSLYEVYKVPCADSGYVDVQQKVFIIIDFFFSLLS